MRSFLFIAGLLFFVVFAVGRYALGFNSQPAPVTAIATPTIAEHQSAPTMTPTLQPVTGDPVRVQFNRGSYGATITGTVGTKYLLWAAQGQTFTTTLSSQSAALVSLTGPDGKPLFTDLAAGYTAASKLPSNGDYALEVRNSDAYTVGVTIR